MDEDSIIETLSNELDVTQQKLKSKVKSIKIIFREYKVACHEKEYYKSLIAKLTADDNRLDLPSHTYELTKENIKLKSDNDSLFEKLLDLTKDLNAYKKVSENDQSELQNYVGNHLVNQIQSDHLSSAANLQDLSNIEDLKEKIFNLQSDNKALQDDVQDLIAERDEYKIKFKRLNAYLNTIMCPNETDFSLDIDKIITENKILMDEYDVLRAEKDILATKLNKQKHFGTNFSSHIPRPQPKMDTKNVICKDKTINTTNPAPFKQRYDITSLYNKKRECKNDTKSTSNGTIRANSAINSNPFSEDDLSDVETNPNNSKLFHILKYVENSMSDEKLSPQTEVANKRPTPVSNHKNDKMKFRSVSEELKEGMYKESMINETQSNSCEPIMSN